ncbi:DUF7331 family protein [Halocatena marina]|uniref:Uncharacterized protein n=1 Tax=Halocatena marina TaxID=2934937 RepID=A0ABD5YGZ9_9EURY|nr:hypothetical protein [Halocatena marina]
MEEKSRTRTDGRYDKYGLFETRDGRLVVYERENPNAWIRSDAISVLEE